MPAAPQPDRRSSALTAGFADPADRRWDVRLIKTVSGVCLMEIVFEGLKCLLCAGQIPRLQSLLQSLQILPLCTLTRRNLRSRCDSTYVHIVLLFIQLSQHPANRAWPDS